MASTEKIGKIVNQKMDVEVLSYDPMSGQIVPRKVVNWFNNGQTEEFLHFTVERVRRQRASRSSPRHPTTSSAPRAAGARPTISSSVIGCAGQPNRIGSAISSAKSCSAR